MTALVILLLVVALAAIHLFGRFLAGCVDSPIMIADACTALPCLIL